MANRIIQRHDTAANWDAHNPILAEGELGFISDQNNRYKIGDGVTPWKSLKLQGFNGNIVQDTGDDEGAVMSQKGVTTKLTELESKIGKTKINYNDGAFVRFGENPVGVFVDIDAQKENNSAFKYTTINVNEGDIINLDIESSPTVGVWCTLDSNNTAVRSQEPGTMSANEQIVIGSYEKTLIINCKISYSGISYIVRNESVDNRLTKVDNRLTKVEDEIGAPDLIQMEQGLIRFGNNPQGAVDINNVEIVESYEHQIIDVNEDDIININAYAGVNVGTWCTLDSNNNAIRFGVGLVNRLITIQNGECKILINNIGDYYSYYIKANTISSKLAESSISLTPNVVYVAAYNSPDEIKKKCHYVCSGNNDQTVINSAIASLEYGGIVHLCAGNYIVDSFGEIKAYAWDCAIGMNDNGKSRHIVIEGDYLPIAPNANSLQSEINISDSCYNSIGEDVVAVIGTSYSVAEHTYYYRNALSLKNIAIVLPNNNKPVIGVLQIHTSIGGCDNVQVSNIATRDFVNDGIVGNAPTPHPLSIGFYGHPNANSNPYTIYNCCNAQGFGTGFAIGGDHNVLINCWTGRNSIGYSFGVVSNCAHHNTLINCCSESDTQFMVLGDKTENEIEPLSIINFQIEKNPELAPEGDDLCCTEVNPNTQWCGEISYTAKPLNTRFFEQGQGMLFKVRNMRSKISGTYEQRPINPNYLEQYYDTELDRMLIWNGETWIEL